MTASASLIAQDSTVTIQDGGAFVPGTAPTFGTAIVLTAECKSISADAKLSTVDGRGFSDTQWQGRPTFSKYTFTADLKVAYTGPVVIALGNIVRITYTPLGSNTSLAQTYSGLLTGNTQKGDLDQLQMQTLVIEGSYDTD